LLTKGTGGLIDELTRASCTFSALTPRNNISMLSGYGIRIVIEGGHPVEWGWLFGTTIHGSKGVGSAAPGGVAGEMLITLPAVDNRFRPQN
jgi:hypothetical protein